MPFEAGLENMFSGETKATVVRLPLRKAMKSASTMHLKRFQENLKDQAGLRASSDGSGLVTGFRGFVQRWRP